MRLILHELDMNTQKEMYRNVTLTLWHDNWYTHKTTHIYLIEYAWDHFYFSRHIHNGPSSQHKHFFFLCITNYNHIYIWANIFFTHICLVLPLQTANRLMMITIFDSYQIKNICGQTVIHTKTLTSADDVSADLQASYWTERHIQLTHI